MTCDLCFVLAGQFVLGARILSFYLKVNSSIACGGMVCECVYQGG